MTTYKQRSPWMHSVILTTAGTNYNLLTLVQAITPGLPTFCRSVQLQVDIGAGAAQVSIGSPDSLSSTDCGVTLVATQAWNSSFYVAGGINLGDIELVSNTNSTQVDCTIVVA
jgi:hypothetical protein